MPVPTQTLDAGNAVLRALRGQRGVRLWTMGAVAACALILTPLTVVAFGVFASGPEWAEVAHTVLPGYIANTAMLVTLVAALSLLMAIPPAWLVSVYDFPGRRLIEWALVLPLAIPAYVAAFVYIEVPERCIPMLIAVRAHGGPEVYRMAEWGLRFGMLALLMASVLFPYLYLTARASFGRQNRALIESALMLGRTPFAVFRTVALPMARPAIAAGLSLVVMEVMNDYGAVNFFGVPTLTEGVFRTWFGLEDPVSGNRLAGFMMLSVLLMLALERFFRGRARYAAKGDAGQVPARRPLRGGALVGAYLVCLCPLLTGLVLPVGRLVVWAVQASRGHLPGLAFAQVADSLVLALFTAVFLGMLAVFIAYALRLSPSRRMGALVNAASLGYATPGAAVAVGLMIVLGALDSLRGMPLLLSGSMAALACGYVVRFAAVPLQSARAGMTRVCGSLDEASRLLGRGPLETLRRVNLPLLREMWVASVMLTFIDILKELPLTMVMRPANFNTLAVSAFGLAKEGRFYEAAAPSLVIVCVGGAGLFVLNRFMGERSK